MKVLVAMIIISCQDIKTFLHIYVTDSWKDNPDFVQYLAELSSFGIEKLSK